MTTNPERSPGVSEDELDRRAAAASKAVRQVTVSIASPTADDQVRRQQCQARVFGVAVVAVLVVPLLSLAVIHRRQAESQDAGPATTTTSVPATSSTQASRPETLPLTPGSPTDGKGSKGFPVDATPFADLQDHQTIQVNGHGFLANAQLGVLMCTSEAAEGGGVDYCDISTVAYVNSDAKGAFAAPFTVSRLFQTSHGARDCIEGNIDPAQFKRLRDSNQHPSLRQPGAWGCIVAAGAINDYDQSGGFPITFGPGPTPTLPPPPVTRVTTPYTPEPGGTAVINTGTTPPSYVPSTTTTATTP